jgi:hypothetical protein
MKILGVSQCFEQFQNSSHKILQSEVKWFSFFSDSAIWKNGLWNMICSYALLRPTWVLIFWLRLGSSLFFPSFPPLLGAIVGLTEFLRVSSFWELMMKPLSSVRYTSHLCMLTKIQNPSVSRIRYMQVAFCQLLGFWSFGSDLGPLYFFLLSPFAGCYRWANGVSQGFIILRINDETSVMGKVH